MKNRLILVINPRSSGFAQVQKKLISYLENEHFEQEFITFEIQPTTPLDNARELAAGLQDGDIIVVAGGDGTAHIATNGATLSGKKHLKMKYTGFGNFNDYAHSFSKNSGKAMVEAVRTGKVQATIRPLEIRINGEFLTHAPLYATVGLTAEMAEIFEGKRLRKALKKVKNRNSRLALSLLAATRFYFKNRQKHILKIAKIEVLGEGEETPQTFKIPQNPTDLVFLNGPRMARIMRSRVNLVDAENFGFTAMNAGDFRNNLPFLVRGFLGKIPLKRVKSTKISFEKPTKLTIQIEGEAQILQNVETLEVSISNQKIEVL